MKINNQAYRADGGDIGTDRIKEIAHNPYGDEEKCWLAKRVLALLDELEAEPVAWTDADELRDVKNAGNGYLFAIGGEANKFADPNRQVMLYTAPPAPVSVPDFGALTKCIVQRLVDYGAADDDAIASAEEFVYNACRAAMLQGAENAESPSSNSPVIPDGWVLVPVEPTEHMIVEGFESWPDEFFSDTEVWEAFQEMSGCQQSAHLAKLCWAAMIAAAPQQEVKL
ncbi:hypothetical protein [Enterobacter cloacae]|uniref:hypothetical protein n=1 Tax=Enterobacter cloacae TaxID=550 RepID=UPI0019D4AE11|nr:hypothetical protein [Enterobacter cloacae]